MKKTLLILMASVAVLASAWIGYNHYVKTAPQIYTYSHVPIPLDPKIQTNYKQPDEFAGLPVIVTTEQDLGSEELRGPILDSFVDLGADGIALSTL